MMSIMVKGRTAQSPLLVLDFAPSGNAASSSLPEEKGLHPLSLAIGCIRKLCLPAQSYVFSIDAWGNGYKYGDSSPPPLSGARPRNVSMKLRQRLWCTISSIFRCGADDEAAVVSRMTIKMKLKRSETNSQYSTYCCCCYLFRCPFTNSLHNIGTSPHHMLEEEKAHRPLWLWDVISPSSCIDPATSILG